MRYTLAVAALVVISASGNTMAAQGDKYCQTMGKVAEAIMTGRQNGAPIGDMMSRAEKAKVEEQFKAIARKLVLEAYEHPAYNTESIKKKTIRDFADAFQLQCYKSLGE